MTFCLCHLLCVQFSVWDRWPEAGFLGQKVNVPVILLNIARNFFTGTRPTVHENLNSSLSVAERECHTFANLIG